MRKYLLPPEGNWYKANLHAHTHDQEVISLRDLGEQVACHHARLHLGAALDGSGLAAVVADTVTSAYGNLVATALERHVKGRLRILCALCHGGI